MNAYAYWQAEIARPGSMNRQAPGPYDGFWRSIGAKTKHDTPIAIWRAEGRDEVVLADGRRRPETLAPDSDKLLRFFSSVTWLKCVAVRKADWDQAMASGYWPDGKPAWPSIEVLDPKAFAVHLVDAHDLDFNSYINRRAKDFFHSGRDIPGVRFTRPEASK